MKAKDLRNSILQLAVQGKLVPQNPNDEPASVLLERIRAERAKLIKEKKIKAPKNGESIIYRGSDGSHYEKRGKGESVCIEDEIPFEIPESWTWARFETVITITSNLVQPNAYGAMPHIAPDSIEKESGKLLPFRTVAEDEVKSSNHLFHKGQLLYSKIRPGLRKVVIAPCDGLCSADVYPLSTCLNVHYAMAFLLGDYFTHETLKGDTRVKMPKTNQTALNAILVPIPPIKEQKRISERAADLMPLITEYGTLEETRETLDAELPDRLRKSILQLAVQGGLVEQDPDDEPASVLLERIRSERARLVKGKKAKASKGGESVIWRASDGGYYEKRIDAKGHESDPVCIDDEIPFDIPDSWEWARISSVFNLVRGSGIKRTEITETGEPCVRYGELYTTYRTEIAVPASHTNLDVYNRAHKLLNGEIVATLTGENDIDIGRTVVNNTGKAIAFGGDLLALKGNYVDGNFAMLCMNAPYMRLQRTAAASGNIIVHLSAGRIGNFLIAIPPTEEQRRIVSRSKELLAALG
ncbi:MULTISPECIES: restriction endonuclease subunit S [unclassified Adlercreutzia]|uniref:restriction endonuclease subunit S n=1 Tax=unclassified Adlercreutzia TaxID=2636013 RepID=UPI0013EB6C0D|nr:MULTISPECIES: restriction endonuclease subunit S [unclassified Adlercreutzia]